MNLYLHSRNTKQEKKKSKACSTISHRGNKIQRFHKDCFT